MADNSRSEFVAEKEAQYGGKMQFSFLCTHVGSDVQRRLRPLTGLLYRVGNIAVFEDFEKTDTVFGFTTRGDNDPAFEKTLIEMPCSSVESTLRIREYELIDLMKTEAAKRIAYEPRNGIFEMFHYHLMVLLMKDGSFQVFDSLGNWNADFQVR